MVGSKDFLKEENFRPYLLSYITLPYVLPYLTYHTIPFVLHYLTLHPILPYLTPYLTKCFTLHGEWAILNPTNR